MLAGNRGAAHSRGSVSDQSHQAIDREASGETGDKRYDDRSERQASKGNGNGEHEEPLPGRHSLCKRDPL
jgi:hypothetical protein